MKILYVTRKFPPTVGGMETAAYELHRALQPLANVCLVKYGGPNKYLPIIYPILLLRALVTALWFRPHILYLQDGMLAPMGVVLRALTRRPCVMSVHGLDVTFKNKQYQKVMRYCFPKMDQLVVGSDQTAQAVQERFPALQTATVIYGVRDTFFVDKPRTALRQQLATALRLDDDLTHKKLIVTTGRLVPRKGVAWFVGSVMPDLVRHQPELVYLVAGNGPDKEAIAQLVETHGLQKHVRMLGYVSDEVRNLLYNTADIFLMPNIRIPGDMEGFGLVALEAASCGTPVFASGIEGLLDAVADTHTGYLLPAQDAQQYVQILTRELKNPSLARSKVRQYVLENFSWEKSAQGYLKIFEKATRP